MVLYCTVNISEAKNFGRFHLRTLENEESGKEVKKEKEQRTNKRQNLKFIVLIGDIPKPSTDDWLMINCKNIWSLRL